MSDSTSRPPYNDDTMEAIRRFIEVANTPWPTRLSETEDGKFLLILDDQGNIKYALERPVIKRGDDVSTEPSEEGIKS